MITPERCELCGDEYHEQADTQADQFGLICPGALAPELLKQTYVDALSEAFSVWVRTQALEGAAEAEKYAEAIEKRRQEWYARERIAVAQDVLQADCDERVPEVQAELVKAEAENRAALDIDAPHMTVPKTEEFKVSHKRMRTSTKPEDYMLYVDPPIMPEPGPPDPTHIPPNDGYYNH